jgi:hypothetical protein
LDLARSSDTTRQTKQGETHRKAIEIAEPCGYRAPPCGPAAGHGGEEYFPVIERVRDELKTVREVGAFGRHPEWESFET